MQTNTNILKISINQNNGASCRQIFWLMMSIFYALFVVRNVISIEFPVSIYLVWVFLMSVFFNETETKALIISFIPLTPGFQSKFAVLICMIFLIIKHFKRLRVPIYALIIPFLMVWEYTHMGDSFSSSSEFLSGFSSLMCLVIIISLPTKHEDTSFFSRVLAISLAVSSIILISNTISTSGQSLISLIREGFRLGAVEESKSYFIAFNANGLGFLCNIAIAGLLTNICFNKTKKIDYFLLVFLILIGCLTVSRTFLLCLAGTIVLFILFRRSSVTQKIKSFFAIAIGILIAFLVLRLAAPNIIENYVERFNDEDITGGRSNLYALYNDFIVSTPKRFLYGIGMQRIADKVGYLKGIEVYSPHNGYQEVILAWGAIGFAFLMLFILCMVLHTRKKNPHAPFMSYLPLILLLVNNMAGQFISSGFKLMSLIFIYLLISNEGKEAKNSNGTEHNW